MAILVDRETVRRHLDFDQALELARQAFIHIARGEAFIGDPGQLGHRSSGRSLKGHTATYSEIPVVGMISNYSFTNDQGRLQSQGYILMHNFRNGQLAAIVEASLIGQMARACNAALASSYLMPANARVHTVIADQVNARQLARAVSRVAQLEECRLVCDGSSEEIGLLADWISKTTGVGTIHATDLPAAVADADIITMDGSSAGTVLEGTFLRPGTHVNSLGAADAEERELDTFAVQRCRVVCDHTGHSRHCAGNLLAAIAEEKWTWDRMHGELGQVILGELAGRTDPQDITLYNSSGMPLTEVMLAWEVQLRALEAGQGQQISLH